MRVLFCAALDGVSCDAERCGCAPWMHAAARLPSCRKSGRRRGRAGTVPFPPPAQRTALVAALAAGTAVQADGRPDGWADFPIYGWRTPGGVELAFSTLCARVREHFADNDEPATIATAEGGWRRPLTIFRFPDDLAQVRLRPRTKVPWAEFAEVREILLDALSDRRQPLLARLAEIAAICAAVVEHKGLPAELPAFTARSFLAWRGFLESRAASAAAEPLADFAAAVRPLFAETPGLGGASMAELAQALAGDWRADLLARVAPAEREIADALEAWLGSRIFAMPLDRDQSLQRGAVEFFEAFAVGLRYLAALCRAADLRATPGLAVDAMALADHFVASSAAKLPAFVLPRSTPGRGPRLADLDMTLGSIC